MTSSDDNATTETLTEPEVATEQTETPAVVEQKDRTFYTFLETLTRAELLALITARKNRVGEKEFTTAIDTQGSYENVLATLINDHSNETDRSRIAIATTIKDPSLFAPKLVREGKIILGTPTPRKASGNGTVVSGADAKAAFAIRTGRLKRVPLYNSGFSIDITQPTNDALNTFLNRAHDETNSYGRRFGAYFYFFDSLMIKDTIIDLITPLILNSNLKNWNRGTTLLKNIKIVDLKLILHAVGALMFPDGFNFTHVCTNPKGTCTHHETLLVDLNKLVRHDYRKLSETCIQHMAVMEEVTQKSLSEYQTKLDFDGREVRYKKWGFTLQVPSIVDILDYGKSFNGTLLSNVFANDDSAIQRAILFSYYRIHTPFVSKVTLYNTDGSADLVSTERDVISDTLASIQDTDKKGILNAAIDQFIAETEISHLCYPAAPCPSCDHRPGSGYYTVDPEQTFFTQALTRLNQS